MSHESAAGRVLVIDDAPMVIQVLTRALEGEGWAVASANSGVGGVRAFREDPPDVVVCDLHMPDMDGYAVLGALHGIDPSVPVVFLSADEDRAAMLEAIRRGGFDYILKSDLGPLLGAIERGARWSRDQRALRACAGIMKELRPKLQILKRHAGLLHRAADGSDAQLRQTIDRVEAAAEHALAAVVSAPDLGS